MEAPGTQTIADAELVPVFLLVWVAGFARVSYGLSQHETIGSEMTIAMIVLLAIPYLLRDTLRLRA